MLNPHKSPDSQRSLGFPRCARPGAARRGRPWCFAPGFPAGHRPGGADPQGAAEAEAKGWEDHYESLVIMITQIH